MLCFMFTIELIYNDENSVFAEVKTESNADLFMIARGWLMCSSAYKVVVWDEDGFDIISYQNG